MESFFGRAPFFWGFLGGLCSIFLFSTGQISRAHKDFQIRVQDEEGSLIEDARVVVVLPQFEKQWKDEIPAETFKRLKNTGLISAYARATSRISVLSETTGSSGTITFQNSVGNNALSYTEIIRVSVSVRGYRSRTKRLVPVEKYLEKFQKGTITVGVTLSKSKRGRIHGKVRIGEETLHGASIHVLDQGDRIASALTDQSGSYELTGIPPGSYKRVLHYRGFQKSLSPVRMKSKTKDLQKHIRLARTGHVTVLPTVPESRIDQEPLWFQATLQPRIGRSQTRKCSVPGRQGFKDIALPRPLSLRVDGPGLRYKSKVLLTDQNWHEVLVPSFPNPDIGRISGRVKLEKGTVPKGTIVSVEPRFDSTSNENPSGTGRFSTYPLVSEVHSGGAFSFINLVPGSYELACYTNGFLQNRRTVTLDRDSSPVINVPYSELSGTVSGTLKIVRGNETSAAPEPGTQLLFATRSEKGSKRGKYVIRQRTSVGGESSFVEPSLAEERYDLFIEGPGSPVFLPEHNGEPQSIDLRDRKSLMGIALKAYAGPVVYGHVREGEWGDPKQLAVHLGARNTVPEPDGRFVFPEVSPGTYSLTVKKDGEQIHERTVTLPPGRNTHRVHFNK